MRILIATDTYYPHVNGVSYFTQRLAVELSLKGHTVAVIAPGEKFKHTLQNHKKIAFYGMPSIPIFISKFRFSLPLFIKKKIKDIIEEFNPQIIHLQGHIIIGRLVLDVARSKKIPVIATNHFMPENLVHFLPVPEKIREQIKKYAWRDLGKVFKEVQMITTPTKSAANLIKDCLPQTIQVISCGIDLKKFNPKNKQLSFYKKYHLPQKPSLLYVGRLDKEKNVDFVLRAVAQALKSIDFHFIIAGIGVELKKLKRLAEKLSIQEKITFLGFVPDKDLSALYCVADCFVIAGIAELQSIVTMEAMASGLPILAVNAVALPELVHDGKNGFLFELNNPINLAEKIITILSNKKLQQSMAKNSLKIISSHNIEKTISAFEKLYQQLINNNSTNEKI